MLLSKEFQKKDLKSKDDFDHSVFLVSVTVVHCGYSIAENFGKHDKSTKMDVYQKGFTDL